MLDPGLVWLEDKGARRFQPLVSAAAIEVFRSLSYLIDPNPRRLKRMVNVYALVIEVAKQMPLSEDDARVSQRHACIVHSSYIPHIAALIMFVGSRQTPELERVLRKACQVDLPLRALPVPHVLFGSFHQ